MILILFAFWLILCQKITFEILLFGVVIVGAVFAFMCAAMNYSFRIEAKIYRMAGLLFCFCLVLIWEVIKANIAVARIVLAKDENYRPIIVHVNIPLKNSLTRTLMANSITLTPGTITVDETNGTYIVYCLDRPMAEGMAEGTICKLLMKMEDILA